MELKNAEGLTEKQFLAQYRPGNYDRPSVTVDMLVFTIDSMPVEDSRQLADKVLKLLLIKRKNHPYMNCWAVPGGFVNIDESLDEAAARELKEETGLSDVYMEQLYTWGEPERDMRMRVISVSYMALVPKDGLRPEAGDDASEAIWFTIRKEEKEHSADQRIWLVKLESEDEAVRICYQVTDTYRKNGVLTAVDTRIEKCADSPDELAFDHAGMINLALERMKNKVNYTPIAFNLLPKEFTLTELQKVYETLLGKPLYKANFRKKVKPMVEETQRLNREGAYRPGKYYRYCEADEE